VPELRSHPRALTFEGCFLATIRCQKVYPLLMSSGTVCARCLYTAPISCTVPSQPRTLRRYWTSNFSHNSRLFPLSSARRFLTTPEPPRPNWRLQKTCQRGHAPGITPYSRKPKTRKTLIPGK
jgi:hypothetical protein